MYKLQTESWYLERILFLIAGVFVLGSVILGFQVNPNFFYFAGFVGLSQLVFGLTGWCLMAIILRSFGVKGKLEK
jgi:hypothetical protein